MPAFALSSAVSVILVDEPYLRLVRLHTLRLRWWRRRPLSSFIWSGSLPLAHFWEGFTGLTVTVLSIATLFLFMQLTGRIRWGVRSTQRERGPAMV